MKPKVTRVSRDKLSRLVDNLFTVVKERSSKDELVFMCEEPGCGDRSGNRSVNLSTGMTNCWRCNKGGPFIRWVEKLGYDLGDIGDVDLDSSQQSVAESIDDLTKLNEGPRRTIISTNNVSLPRGFIPISKQPNSFYAKLIEKMAVRKHLSFDILADAGAGFTREDGLWEPYCIMPVYEWGKLVYYQGRTYRDVPGESTKKFPSKNEVPLGSRYWIYDIDRLRSPKAKIAIAVESIFNTLSLKHELNTDEVVPFAVFKHKISAEQQAKLLAIRGIKEICLMFDPDAIKAAWESCRSLTNLIKVTVAPPLPEGVDPNDDVKAAVKSFENRVRYSSINSLEAEISNL